MAKSAVYHPFQFNWLQSSIHQRSNILSINSSSFVHLNFKAEEEVDQSRSPVQIQPRSHQDEVRVPALRPELQEEGILEEALSEGTRSRTQNETRQSPERRWPRNYQDRFRRLQMRLISEGPGFKTRPHFASQCGSPWKKGQLRPMHQNVSKQARHGQTQDIEAPRQNI